MSSESADQVSSAFVRALVADPAAMGEVIAGLSVTVHDEHDLAVVLGRAARAAASWLPDADWAGMTVTFGGTPFTAGETDPVVRDVDQVQYDAGDGPCLQALRNGEIVTAGPEAAASRWPEFAAGAHARGMRSFLAAPLLEAGVARGAINLYSRSASGFDGHQADRLAVLADLVRRGLAEYTAVTDARTQAAQLREALDSRAPIEQAKGILMAVRRIDENTAFNLLREESQRRNTKLRDVASQFVTRLTRSDEG